MQGSALSSDPTATKEQNSTSAIQQLDTIQQNVTSNKVIQETLLYNRNTPGQFVTILTITISQNYHQQNCSSHDTTDSNQNQESGSLYEITPQSDSAPMTSQCMQCLFVGGSKVEGCLVEKSEMR
jgi:hypothetical protein